MGSRIGVWSADGRPCLPMSSIRLVLGRARARLSMSVLSCARTSGQSCLLGRGRHRLRKGEEEEETDTIQQGPQGCLLLAGERQTLERINKEMLLEYFV